MIRKFYQFLTRSEPDALGLRFLWFTLAMLGAGGLLAMLMRWQLAWPIMKPELYVAILSTHGTIMIFFVVIPLVTSAMGHLTVPRLIGTKQIAFPALGVLSFWLLPLGIIVLSIGLHIAGGGPQAGWTSYPPLSLLPLARGRFDAQDCWYVTLLIFAISAIIHALRFVVTIVLFRKPGLRLLQMPLTVWAQFITSFVTLLATPVLIGAVAMSLLDHQTVTVGVSEYRLTSFFLPDHWVPQNQLGNNAGGGSPLLWQHLFWFYAHPAVYIMILPVMGIISDLLAFYCGRAVVGYRAIIACMTAIAVLGFVVWAHHMFTSGLNPLFGTVFSLSTMLIAVPSGVEVFNWLATLWGGRIRFTVPLLHTLGFVSLFVIGGMSGIFLAAPSVNIHLHDTYFVVAHIHYVLFGGSLFGIFAALTHWLPIVTKKPLNATIGKLHFWVSLIAFNCTFFGMHFLGMGGFPRRVAEYSNYASFAHFRDLNIFITVSAFVLGAAQILFFANLLMMRFRKEDPSLREAMTRTEGVQ